MFNVQAAFDAIEETLADEELELERLDDDRLELTELLERLEEDRLELTELLERLELETELELEPGFTVPQPIGCVDTTISSIQTSASLPLKLWKPNITLLNLSLIQSAANAPLFQSSDESIV